MLITIQLNQHRYNTKVEKMMRLLCALVFIACGVNALHILPCEPGDPGPLGCDAFQRKGGNLGGGGSSWQSSGVFGNGINNRFSMGFQPGPFIDNTISFGLPRRTSVRFDASPKRFIRIARGGSLKQRRNIGSSFDSYPKGFGSFGQNEFGASQGANGYPKGLMFLNQGSLGNHGFDSYPKSFGSSFSSSFGGQGFNSYPKGSKKNNIVFYPKRSSSQRSQFYPEQFGQIGRISYPKFSNFQSGFRLPSKKSSGGY